MVHFILVLILHSSTLYSNAIATVKIDGNYTEEMCNSEGKKQTEGFYVKLKPDNSSEGTWPDGTKWKIEKQNAKFISPKFDSYSCVMVNK